jgi:hypothetical protein
VIDVISCLFFAFFSCFWVLIQRMYFSEILALSSSYVLIYCRPWPMGGGPGGNAPEFVSSMNLLSPMKSVPFHQLSYGARLFP